LVNAFTEIQLGARDTKVDVHRSTIARRAAGGRRDDTAAVRVEQVARHPRAVGDAGRVQLARRHHHLLRTAVDLVSIDVEITHRIERRLSFVEDETIAHLERVELAHVAKWRRIRVEIRRRQRLQLKRTASDIVETHRRPRCLNVAVDVRKFACTHVGLHDEALHDGRIDATRSHGDDDPQHGGEHRQAPAALTEISEEQHRDRERHQDHELRRRQLRVHVGVGGSLHHAARRASEVVARIPVVDGAHD